MWGRISLVTENFGIFDLTDGFTNRMIQSEETTEDNRMRTRRSRKKFCYSHIAFMLYIEQYNQWIQRQGLAELISEEKI